METIRNLKNKVSKKYVEANKYLYPLEHIYDAIKKI